MSTSHSILLGQGYDSLSDSGGAPKASSAIKRLYGDSKAAEQEPSTAASSLSPRHEQKSFDPRSPHTPTSSKGGKTIYDMTLITDYIQLSKALNIQFNASATIGSIAVSPEAKFISEVELSKQTVVLLIQSRTITEIQHISSTATLIPSARSLLNDNPDSFVNTYGDSCITDILYGKSLCALIQYTSTSTSECEKIKFLLEGRLSAISVSDEESSISTGPGAEAKIKIAEEIKKVTQSSRINIKLKYSGVNIDRPVLGSNIGLLLEFIEKYHKAESLQQEIIGFYTKSYTSYCKLLVDEFPVEEEKQTVQHKPLTQLTAEESTKQESNEYTKAAHLQIMKTLKTLEARIENTRKLQNICKDYIQRLRYIISTCEQIYKGVSKISFQTQEEKKHVGDLNKVKNKANNLQQFISTLLKHITQDRANPNAFYSYIKLKMQNQPDEIMLHHALETFLFKLNDEVDHIEHTVNTAASHLSTEIATIKPNANYFYLSRLPNESSEVRWTIHFLREDKNNDPLAIKFKLKKKTTHRSDPDISSCRTSCWRAMRINRWKKTPYRDIGHGFSKTLELDASDQLKLEFNNPRDARRQDFLIKCHVIGQAIFSLDNTEYFTTWNTRAFAEDKATELPAHLHPEKFFDTIDNIISAAKAQLSRSLQPRPLERKPTSRAQATKSLPLSADRKAGAHLTPIPVSADGEDTPSPAAQELSSAAFVSSSLAAGLSLLDSAPSSASAKSRSSTTTQPMQTNPIVSSASTPILATPQKQIDDKKSAPPTQSSNENSVLSRMNFWGFKSPAKVTPAPAPQIINLPPGGTLEMLDRHSTAPATGTL